MEMVTGKVAIHAAVPTRTTPPTATSAMCARGFENLDAIPAKKSAEANRTTART